MANAYINLSANAGPDWETLGTVPVGKSWVFTGLSGANNTSASQSVSVRYTDASNSNQETSLATNVAIATVTTSSLMLGKLVLNAGDVLQVKGTNSTPAFGQLIGNRNADLSAAVFSAYGGSKLVLIGSTGIVSYTTDWGTTWSAATDVMTGNPTCLAYGGSMFVTHNGSNFITSADGITWTTRTAVTATINQIIHNGTRFVAVGNTGVIYTSDDGVTWTSRTSGVSVNINGVAWSGSMFLAVGAPATSQAISVTSSDGITWTANTANAGNVTLSSVVWVPTQSVFYASVQGSSIFTTSNGISYTSTGVSAAASSDLLTDGVNAVASISSSGGIYSASAGQSTSIASVVSVNVTKHNGMYADGKFRWVSNGQIYASTSFASSEARNVSFVGSAIEVAA